MTKQVEEVSSEWRKLSPWSIFHFAAKAIFQNVQSLIFFGPATYGLSQSDFGKWAWMIPLGVIGLVLIGSLLTYLFYSYRVLEDCVQVRRGALFKKNLNLSFERIQNINLEHPFYFRPLGLVTLKIDGAGAKEEEVDVAALNLPYAKAIRSYILARKSVLKPESQTAEDKSIVDVDTNGEGEVYFTRSLSDLIVHGLTNNRSFIAIAALLTFIWQSNFSFEKAVSALGIDFDVIIAGLSLVRLILLFALSLILTVGIIAVVSVLVAIVTYYGFTMQRSKDSISVKRGLLTRHEIHVKKSRIQTVTLRQDWLDFLLKRRNIIFERISHSQNQGGPMAAVQKRIFVPSVRVEETVIVTEEILPDCKVEDIEFTPVNIRYLYKYSLINTVIYLMVFVVSQVLGVGINWFTGLLLALWCFHLFLTYMTWKRGGLALLGDIIIARSGTIGIDYHLFSAFKVQDVSHIQSILMKRRNVSSIVFHTASNTIKVPYMDTVFMKSVIDYCAYSIESTRKSWM